MVSVIIPNYNAETWLPKTLTSCLEQGKWLTEIIVVDDHSSDNSWSILEYWQAQHPGKIKIFKNPGKGANAARSHGYTKSTGTYIQWLDSDDQLIGNKLERQIEALSEKNADIVYSDCRLDYYDNRILQKEETKYGQSYEDYLKELLLDNWMALHSYLLTRKYADIAHQLMGWNPDTPCHQDTEFITKIAIAGAKFVYLPGVHCVYNKRSNNSISQTHFKKKKKTMNQLYRNFLVQIAENQQMTEHKKKEYSSIINTNLVQNSFYVKGTAITTPFRFADINQTQLTPRIKHLVFPLYVWQHLRLLLKIK